jgi:hypothetical protein
LNRDVDGIRDPQLPFQTIQYELNSFDHDRRRLGGSRSYRA